MKWPLLLIMTLIAISDSAFAKSFYSASTTSISINQDGQLDYHNYGFLTPAAIPINRISEWMSQSDIFIGISDPVSDSLISYNQAISRAWIMYLFTKGVYAEYISDTYKSEISSTGNSSLNGSVLRFITAKNISLSNYQIVDSFRTDNKELILFLNFSGKGKKIQPVKTSFYLDYYIKEQNISKESCLDRLIYLDIQSQDKFDYAIYFVNNDRSVSSSINKNRIDFASGRYKYISDTNASNADGVDSSLVWADMRYGLWNAYLESFTNNISKLDFNDFKIKSLSDLYNQKIKGFFRETSRKLIKVKISGVKFDNNRICIEIEQ